ncbi:protein translocase subunit SecD [Sphingomonas sp. SM33]|jgi:preprotein translocase subunit SecD|uniref:Protein translocase subunit SecD n=1 Tax=Sphingomonas telluris TaxID=2907998 RepID=A0ABS9VN74_9SPHN|nr:protein translocase subunit SecD [Sphingomonas telluris]MCH8616420.1 protein translocase subunit SecD [Sphingomonas telluris]
MLEFPRWKVWLVTLVVALGVFFSIPSLIIGTPLENKWPSWFPHYKISLGLDLAGGSHLLLEADAKDAQRQRLQSMEESVSTELRRGAKIDIGDISTAGGRLSFLVRDPTQVDAAVERLRKLTQPVALTGNRDWDVQVVDSTRIVLTPTASGTAQALKDAMGVARDVVRRRIDPGGTKEITVITEGGNRILVQVPGVEDPEALKNLIGQTARLEFKLVDLTADPAQVQQGRAPAGSQVLPMAEGGGFIAVKRRVMVSGDQLTDARQSFDQDGRAVVSIKFNTAGARRFGRVTQENVNKPFAIILDDKVLSAPNINEPILGGQAQISGNFTVETANQLAVSLASGKLPVKLNVIEERSVGPDLGKDSIHKGVIASAIGMVGIMIFMLVTYGRFGVYANIALIVNAFLILAIMAIFNATLTLPGIAGFILTIGAAVDANVLINERIREEMRRGRKLIDAVETGYHEAFRAIFDANVTHVVSAAIMAYFGSGPVRGFAVVLLIGVVTSVFTAVYFTRMLVALWIRRARPRALHI